MTQRPLVAVIDFRQPELSRAFRGRLEEALARLGAAAGIEPRIAFVNAPLPRSSFAAEVRALEAQRPDIYYATTTDIARDIRSANARSSRSDATEVNGPTIFSNFPIRYRSVL